MRQGVNPEKLKNGKNTQFLHRVILPVYIPNVDENYYKHSLEVLDWCLNSLTQTINSTTTAITVLNNNSAEIVTSIIEKYKPHIDKIVLYKENRGKVYTVFSEAKSAYEPFITIADADVLFFSGWEKAVFEIFNTYKKAGVVSPVPSQSLALNNNRSVFFDNFIFNQIKYDKIVADKDCDLYLMGMGNQVLLNRNNYKYSWREKQYYLNKNPKALLGASHFVATYRKQIFEIKQPFPHIKFKNGFENIYLDAPSDSLGWYRLSTVKTYAYHLASKVDDFMKVITFDNTQIVNKDFITSILTPKKSYVPFFLKVGWFKILKKIKNI